MHYADIIIDISHESVDRTFQYRIPDALLKEVGIGSCVDIPFGRGNTKRSGYVVDISDEPKIDPSRIKDIYGLTASAVLIESELIRLAYWMKAHYGSTMTRALKTVIPIKKMQPPKEAQILHLAISEEEAKESLLALISKKRHSVSKERLLKALIEDRVIPRDVVREKLNIPSPTIKELEKKGILRIERVRDFRNPLQSIQKSDRRVRLSDEQQVALDAFLQDYRAGVHRPFLLYGVTGSGKTEVYMEMIAHVLNAGKEAIMLIPEIALTYQTLMRFYGRFGSLVSVLHSRLSPGERFDQFERAKSGDIKIMIGPRSALFTPFPNLGLIIIDEEHESTYKSEQVPKYHARETAVERAKIAGASVVLGSATPSMESFYRCEKGEYRLQRMPHRILDRPLANCEIVDLRAELKAGNRSILSRRLMEQILECLQKKEQIMLFINRRGLMGFLSCRACGHVIKCPHCDVSLSLHRDGKMHCHYCGHVQARPSVCPECGSKYISTFKAGTQKIEEIVKETFPAARVLRMDADTTKGKDGHRDILSAFANAEADILIGTQMIVKGHDFSNVTLVGILAADQSLNDHDFRSAERTFQLLTQAAGRAGRGEVAGNVIIQTYQPDHYSIVFAKNQDYDAFYTQEIAYRSLLQYPPAGHMLLIQFFGAKEEAVRQRGLSVSAMVEEFIEDGPDALRSSGLLDAGISRINDIYRKVIYLKHTNEEVLVNIKDQIEKRSMGQKETNVSMFFDFDPMQMF